jgi:large subunit ribosomal protein L1
MAKRGKKYVNLVKKLGTDKSALKITEAIKQVKKQSYSKFTGTVEMHVAIFVPKDKEAKSIKGSIALPFPMEKKVRIYVFTTPENVDAAIKAGAEKAGLEDLVKEIKAGTINFDVAIATPDVMPKIAVLGKELGPKGLMPNPRNGTVAMDVVKAIGEYKKGKLNFACDDSGVLHYVIGKIDSEDTKMIENANACIAKTEEILAKPAKQIIKSVYLAPSMGPSVKVELEAAVEVAE